MFDVTLQELFPPAGRLPASFSVGTRFELGLGLPWNSMSSNTAVVSVANRSFHSKTNRLWGNAYGISLSARQDHLTHPKSGPLDSGPPGAVSYEIPPAKLRQWCPSLSCPIQARVFAEPRFEGKPPWVFVGPAATLILNDQHRVNPANQAKMSSFGRWNCSSQRNPEPRCAGCCNRISS